MGGLAEACAQAWASFRNQVFMSERFQAFAVRMPFTQAVSNRYAERLFDLAVGFSYARVLHACVSLNILHALKDGPLSLEALSQTAESPASRLLPVLEGAVALEILEMARPMTYRLGPLGAALLGNPGVAAMIRHHELLYADLADMDGFVRGQAPSARVASFWPYESDSDGEAVARYSALMAATQAMIARLVLNAYSMRPHRQLMDVGGGEGAFASAAVARWKTLRACVADLPAVARRAQGHFQASPSADRLSAVGVDARTGELPGGADLISFVRVLHDHNDDDVMQFLAQARRALMPEGRVLIAEPMAGGDKAGAYFGPYLLAMGQGRFRSPKVLADMARDAGYSAVRVVKTAQPVLVRLLILR